MAGGLFDVFVVGSVDASAAEQTKLASGLAARLSVPVAVTARGLAEKKFRAGQGLTQGQAEGLVRELQALGAVTVIRPAGGGTGTSIVPTLTGAGPPAPAHARPSPFGTPPPPPPSNAIGPQGATVVVPAPRAEPPAFAASFGPPGAPPGPPPVGLTATLPGKANAFAPPPSRAPVVDLFAPPAGDQEAVLELAGPPPDRPAATLAPAAPPSRPVGGGTIPVNPFAPPDDVQTPALELDSGPADSSDQMMRVMKRSRSLPGTSGLNLATMTATSSASGLTMDEDAAAKMHSLRCPKHGLYYDKRKASGCRKCLESSRKIASSIQRRSTRFPLLAFSDNPLKRALVGVAFALLVGFIPAAYNALRVGSSEVTNLRDEQALLSKKPGTEEVVKRYDQIDEAVRDAHDRSLRNTGLIWFLVAGGVLAGWYRITAG